ncbi:hypothetical protein SARC_00796 [Sphaeroforma arctica JP610]|uniref:Uncharacterized protein n=1 Tax=Sphaeroforma arctica JP610 TaxID=667725 RepID=A0A0L0GDG7_9EUKA|nr:hypothetical protein SARC_00796 [Sphaeroforma arctica JP610]KNC87050.1 hypothetical protein SARC_00796 [Sphaeroforma arctica JP610]|eukprot:XP_014160952.1 hypothetical protein SARC_00796 [Sphaeroforma arctica JP610]
MSRRGGRGGGGGGGGGRGGHGGGGGGDKKSAFFDSIRTENVKTLSWSLRYGGFEPTRPYNDDDIPPIHLAVHYRKLRSLRTILESIDRMRDNKTIEYRDINENLTPLQLACRLGWADGVTLLLNNGADTKATDKRGLTPRQIAEKAEGGAKCVSLIDEWEKDSDDEGPKKETEAEKRKKEVLAAQQQQRAEDSKAKENADLAAKDAFYDDLEKTKEVQESASALAKWEELKVALADLKKEVHIDKSKDEENGKAIDPTLWTCGTLTRLSMTLSPGALTSLPSDISKLSNLKELILTHNALAALPDEIGTLVHLRVLEVEHNELTSLPDSLKNCTKLEVVMLSNNMLESLAPLCGAPDLLTLQANNNNLTLLDFPLDGCPRLTTLLVAHNQLESLPAEIGTLSLLKSFDASHNQLKELPIEMGGLSEKKMTTLQLEGNAFTDRNVKKILEKSRQPAKELFMHLRKQKGGGKKKK